MRHDFFPPPQGPFNPGLFYRMTFPNGDVTSIKAYSEGSFEFLTKNGQPLMQASPSFYYNRVSEFVTIKEIPESEAVVSGSFSARYKIGNTYAEEFNYEDAIGKVISYETLEHETPAVQFFRTHMVIHYLVSFPYQGSMQRLYVHEDDLIPVEPNNNKTASFFLDEEGY